MGQGDGSFQLQYLRVLEDIFESPLGPLVVFPAFQGISVRHLDSSKTLATQVIYRLRKSERQRQLLPPEAGTHVPRDYLCLCCRVNVPGGSRVVTVICAHSCAPRHQHGLQRAGAVEVHPEAQTLRGPQLLTEEPERLSAGETRSG